MHAVQSKFLVRLRVGLVPRPATLVINSRLETAELLVDGSPQMMASGAEPAFVPTPPIHSGLTEIEFVPGTYRLQLRAGGESASIRVALSARERLVLRVEERNGELNLIRMEE